MPNLIDTDTLSMRYRTAAVDLDDKRLLITNFHGTEQEVDLTELANCNGYGRIRHFRREASDGWPSNPLPIDPASKALGLARVDLLRAQVFQNAVCNWRCWYCFVPFDLLSANHKHSGWLSAADLIDLYLDQAEPPPMIDLTGGQPDLVPEWVPWIMAELRARGLDRAIYLWSDDNLSTDYLWRFLTDDQLELLSTYPSYGRVCCFKGFNSASFTFNTKAEPSFFDRQFKLMGKLLDLGLDIYAYTTFTTPFRANIREDMSRFVDRLQTLDENLPLRTVPLEIKLFTPTRNRLDDARMEALEHQRVAVEAWCAELELRFPSVLRDLSIADVPLRSLRARRESQVGGGK